MTTESKRTRRFAAGTILSYLAVLLLGYLQYGQDLFLLQRSAFTYVSYGLIGAVYLHALRLHPRNALAALFVLAMTNAVLLERIRTLPFLFRDLMTIGGMGAALYLFHRYQYHRVRALPIFIPLVLAAMTGLCMLGTSVLWILIVEPRLLLSPGILYHLVRMFFLIGLGLGLGAALLEEPARRWLRRMVPRHTQLVDQ